MTVGAAGGALIAHVLLRDGKGREQEKSFTLEQYSKRVFIQTGSAAALDRILERSLGALSLVNGTLRVKGLSQVGLKPIALEKSLDPRVHDYMLVIIENLRITFVYHRQDNSGTDYVELLREKDPTSFLVREYSQSAR